MVDAYPVPLGGALGRRVAPAGALLRFGEGRLRAFGPRYGAHPAVPEPGDEFRGRVRPWCPRAARDLQAGNPVGVGALREDVFEQDVEVVEFRDRRGRGVGCAHRGSGQ